MLSRFKRNPRWSAIPVLLACLCLSALLAACATQPILPAVPTGGVQSTATPAVLPTPTPVLTQPTAVPAIEEPRLLVLEWPATIRAGDSATIRLTLKMDESGNITPNAEIEGNEIGGQPVSIPNLYDTHNVVAEARLDMAGLEVRPGGMVSQALLPGREVTFFWSLHPEEVGKYRGTVWFFLQFIPKEGGPSSERAIAALPIDVEAVTLFGIKAEAARLLGIGGSMLSAVLGMPFLEAILKWVWRKVRRR